MTAFNPFCYRFLFYYQHEDVYKKKIPLSFWIFSKNSFGHKKIVNIQDTVGLSWAKLRQAFKLNLKTCSEITIRGSSNKKKMISGSIDPLILNQNKEIKLAVY